MQATRHQAARGRQRGFRRLSDILRELNLVDVQLQLFQEGAGPHYGRDLGVRIAALHRRLDDLEQQLRLRARALGQDDKPSLTELRTRLGILEHRYDGRERRTSLPRAARF